MNACCEIIRGRPLLCRPSAGIQEALLCLLGVVLLVFCDWHPLVTISLRAGNAALSRMVLLFMWSFHVMPIVCLRDSW